MADSPARRDPNEPEDNPLGLGSRGSESSNTGSTADTSYAARDSDPYTTGEPRKGSDAEKADSSRPADPDVPSSDEP